MKSITWRELCERIHALPEEKKDVPVIVWGECTPYSECCMQIADEDYMCADGDESAYPRSSLEEEEQSECDVIVKKGDAYLWADF